MHETVRAGGGNGGAGGANKGEGHWMAWHAHRDRLQACCDQSGNAWPGWQDQGKGSGPESLREEACLVRNMRDELLQGLIVGDMCDQRIAIRATFGGKDLLHRLWLQGIGTQAIDRLRWEDHQLTRS